MTVFVDLAECNFAIISIAISSLFGIKFSLIVAINNLFSKNLFFADGF